MKDKSSVEDKGVFLECEAVADGLIASQEETHRSTLATSGKKSGCEKSGSQ